MKNEVGERKKQKPQHNRKRGENDEKTTGMFVPHHTQNKVYIGEFQGRRNSTLRFGEGKIFSRNSTRKVQVIGESDREKFGL